jgi:hypothetical protein
LPENDLVMMRTFVESVKRTSRDTVQVCGALDSKETVRSLRALTRPASLSGTIRKTGIALAIAPEPFTTVIGIGMIAGSYLMKSREPASLKDLTSEATALLGDFSSLSLADLSISM